MEMPPPEPLRKLERPLDDQQLPATVSLPPKLRWTDLPYIFLFFTIVIGFIVIASIDLTDYNRTRCYRDQFGDVRVAFFSPRILAIVAVCITFAFVFSALYFTFAAACTKKFIFASMILQTLVSLGTAVFYLAQRRWLSGVFNIVWLLFSCFLYWALSSSIEQATRHLEVVMRIAEHNPTTIFISILAALFCGAWAILVGSATLASFAKAVTKDCSLQQRLRPEGEFLGLLAYIAATNYLVTEVVKAVVRVAICNTYGWWYYRPREGDERSHNGAALRVTEEFPSLVQVTWEGVFLGLTYSFGSVCFAGLWLAILKLLSQGLGAWSQALIVNSTVRDSQDISLLILAWAFSNCVSYLDSALTHFTNYILVHVALYNSTYAEGFKRSLTVIKTEGWKAVVNDCLAGGTLTFAPWCIGTIVALMAYVYMRWISPYPIEGIFFVSSYVMVIGAQVTSVFTTGISSGAETIFVAMSHEPNVLLETHPEIYRLLAP